MDINISPIFLRQISTNIETKKRSLIPILGNVLNTLIGTGTEETEEKIIKNVHTLEKNVNILDHEINAITENINISISHEKTIRNEIMEDGKHIMILEKNISTLYFLNIKCNRLSNIIITKLSGYLQITEKLIEM